MRLEIQWFIYALVENQLLTLEDCMALYEQLDQEIDITSYAQEILNALASQMPEDELEEIMEQFQAVMEFAVESAEQGTQPEMFAGYAQGEAAPAEESQATHSRPIVQSFENVPSLEGISYMSDEEVANLMINLLTSLRELGASDLHLSATGAPFVRRSLIIEKLSNQPLEPDDAKRLNMALLTEEQRAKFQEDQDLNFALEVGEDRFRVSLMEHKDGMGGSYRLVPDHIRSLAELGFLESDIKVIERLLDYHNGLILVTGPLGCGKTSTLASMVDVINKNRHDHVISVEDPIEILQTSTNCNITQRQIGKDTKSYSSALKGALREDPDIIVIGELHDLETIENAITASETGHLVIGTLHTKDAANTLNRLLDVFPPSQQPQIRAMTAGSLRGIVCQQLIPTIDGGLTVAYELLVNNMAVANIINDGRTHRLKSVMETGQKAGMCTFDNNLFNRVQLGQVDPQLARGYMYDASIIAQLDKFIAINEAKKLAAGGQ
ncbi:MAG: PilT/PilU family type 4a pilus ATPase [Lentisphaerae bacterium]|nr:PilT/PilU family type 4a pilus ATPase [Lentisphaerota bacterium]MCP4102128.1 PilT/PilU family type 4a pilus ATPase [Lentisphaerota bacterium]